MCYCVRREIGSWDVTRAVWGGFVVSGNSPIGGYGIVYEVWIVQRDVRVSHGVSPTSIVYYLYFSAL